jgi:hypothetical protein
MCGFLPPEVWEGATYRWTAPSAVVEMPIAEGVTTITLRHVPLRPPVHDPGMAVYLDGRCLRPIAGCEPSERKFLIEDGMTLVAGALHRLAIICDPFVPARASQSEDTRRLGIALVAIELGRV